MSGKAVCRRKQSPASDETTKAIEAFFYSLVYEDNDAVKHELDEIGKNLYGGGQPRMRKERIHDFF